MLAKKIPAIATIATIAASMFVLVQAPKAGEYEHSKNSFTAVGHWLGDPIPGIPVVDSQGRTFLRGNVHVVRLDSDDARVAGRVHAWMDLERHADGISTFRGPGYVELGTWDGDGGFHPTGGVWAMDYHGDVQVDGSTTYDITARGISGPIEGLRAKIDGTRAPNTLIYNFKGVVKPTSATGD